MGSTRGQSQATKEEENRTSARRTFIVRRGSYELADNQHYLIPRGFSLSQILFVSTNTPSTESSLSLANPTQHSLPEKPSLHVPLLPFFATNSPWKRTSPLPPQTQAPVINSNPVPAAAPPLTHQLFILPYTTPPTNMTTVFKMPLRGTNVAPKFDGTPARLILYLEDIEQLSDHAGHTSEQRIKLPIRYTPADESET
ncbi:hypothetical protein CY34DRAFT_18896 [Suillus luteus UH-Slu-Lm8-n1]|uniref:Uncharacterized protein n=1 Tax=Suillus luteus UH-Slu-Lm8-n1 TaxID=930992 RepID=A0A0D0A358_9AGAM|nr:hypothetical protein CY34DRAFT_18896 [Suillus luteus UH-Slu-Lm8-n1]